VTGDNLRRFARYSHHTMHPKTILNIFVVGILLQSVTAATKHGGITLREHTEDCDLEISYLDIQFFCHTAERPSFYIGKGEFVAVDHWEILI